MAANLQQVGRSDRQEVFDHELVAVLDKPKIGEKSPHGHARRGEHGQTQCRGDLSRRRPCGVGPAIRRPPVLVSVHEPAQFPRPGELPQERGCALWAVGQAATFASDIKSPIVRRYGGSQRSHRTRDRADRTAGFECVGKPVTDPGMCFIRLAIGDDVAQGPTGPGSNRGELSAAAPAS
jgi:hypothetical protein